MRPDEFLHMLQTEPPDTDECVRWPYSCVSRLGGAAYRGTTVPRILLGLSKGDGLVARHTCHQHWCVNPRHLLSGTPADNSRDMVEAGRSLRGTRNPQGHRGLPVDK